MFELSDTLTIKIIRSNTDIDWDGTYSKGRDYAWLDTASVNRLVNLVPEGADKTAVDIGCGTGQLARDLAHRGFAVEGRDSSATAISLASASIVGSTTNITFVCADALEPLPQTYELVIAKYVVAFVSDLELFFRIVRRAMSANAVFIIITPVRELLPPERRSISVDEEDLRRQLLKIFPYVTCEQVKTDWWITATHKRQD